LLALVGVFDQASALIECLGLIQSIELFKYRGIVAQHYCDRWILWPKDFFAHSQSALVERFGFGVFAFVLVDAGEIVECIG